MPVYFYSTREVPYGCFSNFSPHGFEAEKQWWQTSEHYFQAQKFNGTAYADLIRLAHTPHEAARLGRARRFPIRDGWEEMKDQVMYHAVLRKFETHCDIRTLLLATGNELIVENAPSDYYWGCGADGTGKNMLGRILVRVREVLRRRESR